MPASAQVAINSSDMPEFPTNGANPLWIASYPRSGNTFLRILLQNAFLLPSYSIYHVEGDPHGDPSAEALEAAPFLPQNWRNLLTNASQAPAIPIKTHGPPTDDAPAIFIARDGRAAIHSYYHYHKKFSFEQPTLTEVIAGACQFGSWSEHYSAWRPKTRPNTLLLQYDDLVGRPQEVIPRLAKFLCLTPRVASLPPFDELRQRSPAFFRRGQNRDYLNEWTPLEMALFNHLHATAMEDLGFPLEASAGTPAGAIRDLAHTAARLHRLYLQQLSTVGQSIANHQEDVRRLSEEIRELSRQVEQELKPLRTSRWVRAGLAIGVLRKTAMLESRSPRTGPHLSPNNQAPAPGKRLRSSGENTQSSSPDLQTRQPSVPSEDVSAPG